MMAVKRIAIAAAVLIAIYVASYLYLSAQGCYEAATFGIGHVKSYSWAPQGSFSQYKWRMRLLQFYLPLYYLDRNFWHTDDKAYSGRFPIHEVKPEEASKGQT
jgi:hypothetical protein